MNHLIMQISLFLSRLLSLYAFLIWVRIFISWIVPYPRPGSFTYYLGRIIDPYLNVFRTSRAQMGMLDFSPILAVGVLSILQSVLYAFGIYGALTFGYVLAVIIQAFWNYGLSIFIVLSIISLVLSTIASFTGNPRMYAISSQMNAMPRLKNAVRMSFGARIVRDSTVNIITLLITLLMYFVASNIVNVLINMALRIPF